jgi:hypothetical protein
MIFEPTKEWKEPMEEEIIAPPRGAGALVDRVAIDIDPIFADLHPKEPINESLKRIRNLIHIRADDKLGVALEDWESSEKAYRERVHRKKKVLRNTRHEVITLTGFFLALQGLLLTAAAISSSSQCTNLGFLLAVSGLVTFCALAFVCHKEVTMRRLQSVIVLEKAVQKVLFDILSGSNAKGPLLEILCTADFLIAALL